MFYNFFEWQLEFLNFDDQIFKGCPLAYCETLRDLAICLTLLVPLWLSVP